MYKQPMARVENVCRVAMYASMCAMTVLASSCSSGGSRFGRIDYSGGLFSDGAGPVTIIVIVVGR